MHGLFEDVHAPFLRYIPAFETIFTSLYSMEDNQIAKIGQTWLKAALLTQKYSHDPRKLLEKVAPILRSIEAAMDGNFFIAFSIYFTRSLDLEPGAFQKLVDTLPADSKPQAMLTLYDRLMAKGREEGLEQGLEKGLEKGLELAKREAIRSGFQFGIPIHILCLQTGFSEEKVIQILKELKDAEG